MSSSMPLSNDDGSVSGDQISEARPTLPTSKEVTSLIVVEAEPPSCRQRMIPTDQIEESSTREEVDFVLQWQNLRCSICMYT